MIKNFLRVSLVVIVTLSTGCGKREAPQLEAFRHLPANRLAAFQIDAASLRRSLLPLPKELSGVDRVSGVITAERKLVKISEPPVPAGATTSGQLPDISAIPADSQFWLLGNPRGFSHQLQFGKTSIDLPEDVLDRATKIVAYGHGSALGLDLTLDIEYANVEDAQRLAPTLRTLLHMARGIETQISTRDNHMVIQAKLSPQDAARVLLGPQ